MRLRDLLDVQMLQRLAEANYQASGMPIGIIDATDGSVLVGSGWQDICTLYHRANPITVQRCRESDDYIKANLSRQQPCEYTCRNGLRDIGLPIRVAGQHLATLFLGQFFYEGESPDRAFFVEQAQRFGFDERAYLAALDRVPVFPRAAVANILSYNAALAGFIAELAEGEHRRRKAEQAEQETMQRLHTLLENSPVAVIEWSSVDFRIARWAGEATRMFGWTADEAIGKRIDELNWVFPDDWPLVERAMADMLSGARPRNVSRNRNVRKDGVVIHCEWYNSTVADASGRLGAVLSLVLDVTDRKRIEQELRDANRAKDDFLGMLSHELRNPLAPIRNSLYVLDHAEPTGQQARRAKEVAGRQLAHLTRLVDDLLDVTRIVRGKVELRRSDLDLVEITRRIAEDHRALLRERGIEFRVDTPREPIWINADETRLAQVIGNLLHNAAKFTPDGGRVTVTALALPGSAELHVSDTGTGIDADLLQDIFNPFVQAKQSLARTEGGLGLGLALVKGLVELHGGSVAATSAGQDRGATFTVRLPRTASPRDAGASGPAEEPAPTPPLRVLVVDDNRDAAESMAEVVRMLGHSATVAFDGWTAVKSVQRDPPDIVLCDIGLPGMSGYQVAQALRADERFDSVQLVAVSGYAQPEDQQRALDAGFAEHIAKPADPAKVLHLLAGRRQTR